MDVALLSRIQFGLTVGFHYIFPPLSIGLGLILVIMEGTYLHTKNTMYHEMTRFWVKIFGLIFALGAATGIVMEFQFGTNWATYSRFVGDVFGSALAAEGIFAFFLESGFLAVLLFGWDKVSAKMHFFATLMVAFGAHLSAVWIVVANSWQQTPAGHHIVGLGETARAEIVDFWQLVFNPSTLDRISHVFMGAWQAAAFLVISVAAYYLIRNRHEAFARASMKIALVVAVVASLGQLGTGHTSARTVAATQPAKMAAFEGHFAANAPAGLYLFGWVDEESGRTTGLQIPGFLSWLIYFDTQTPVAGLDTFPPGDRPPVNLVFQSYHIMVGIGMALIGLSLLGLFLWWRRKLFDLTWFLWICVMSVILPQIANQMGWFSAEVGRQPWIVYGLLRTSEAVSKTVPSGNVLTSIILFSLVYLLLFILFLHQLTQKIKHGPEMSVVAEGGRV